MSLSPPASESAPSSPFVIRLSAEDLTPNGYFRPAASVLLTPALRTSGLLRDLPGEEIRTLLLMLTFVTANGECLPTLTQLAEAMRLSSGKMQSRLERLQSFSWKERTLVHKVERETGMHAYAPSNALVRAEHAPSAAPEHAQAPYVAAGREAVIAHSRAAYARPRAEVEREMAELNGWDLPTGEGRAVLPQNPLTPEERVREHLRQRLLRLGVSNEQVDYLLACHPQEEVARQLDWLPHRNAKKPAGFVVAAIQGAYAEPPLLRQMREAESAAAPENAADVAEAGSPDPLPAGFPESESLVLPASAPEAQPLADETDLSLPSEPSL